MRRALAAGSAVVLLLAGCASWRVATPAPPAPPRATPPSGPPPAAPAVFEQKGRASWYGEAHHGRRTASGEIYDMHQLTAAHRTLPLGTRLLVTNVDNGQTVEVRVNDRGPFADGRILDLSYAAARQLGAVSRGVIPVHLRVIPPPAADGPSR